MEAGCRFGDPPVAVTDVLGLVEEVQGAAVGQLLEPSRAGFEQLAPTRLELAVCKLRSAILALGGKTAWRASSRGRSRRHAEMPSRWSFA